jgi:hypothetical protein
MILSPGARLGPYEILTSLGAGGMGEVYRARDPRLGREVAIKILPDPVTGEADRLRRFKLEAEAASALNHPNILVVYDVGTEGQRPYVVTELLKGETLRERLAEAALPLYKAVDFGVQIAHGLAAAHERGIVHRDLKPENLFVTRDGVVKILDFGLAKMTQPGTTVAGSEATTNVAPLTHPGTVMGTVGYMSPEQVRGSPADHRSDIFAFGTIIYEMLSGRRAFRGDSAVDVQHAILREQPPSLPESSEGVSPGLTRVVRRCLEKRAEERFQSSRDLAFALETVATPPPGDVGHPGPGTGVSRPKGETNGASSRPPTLGRRLLRAPLAFPLFIVLLAVCAGIVWLVHQSRRVRWARYEALPEIVRLSEQGEHPAAFQLASEAEKYIPDDPLLAAQWPRISWTVSIETAPDGARVSAKEYDAPDAGWRPLGRSPLEDVRVPARFFRWRFEKPGFHTVERAGRDFGGRLHLELDPQGSLPPGMARVPGGRFEPVLLINIGHSAPVDLNDFLLDRHEVTNRQFKEFVDAGGYRNRQYWKHEVVGDGRTVSWDEAEAFFVDSTGRPGPATWEVGTYPEGQGEHPATGISWYEAAAYAEFAGKRLPSLQHWMLAAGVETAEHIIPFSNFGPEGLSPVGTHLGMSPSGVYDMAGSAREWTWNQAPGVRFVLGGAWSQPSYLFNFAIPLSPLDRSASNGFRCMRMVSDEPFPEEALGRIDYEPARDYSQEQPVSEEIFAAYKSFYAFDRGDLEPEVELVDDSPPHWIRERITFNAAYAGERIIAHLFLPKAGEPPYQTVVYFPGSSAFTLRSSDKLPPRDYILKSGRAMLFPVYKSMYERRDGYVHPPTSATLWRNKMVLWYQDLARSIDYLETREDIDSQKLAFLGASLGGHVGVVLLALEERTRAAILLNGGFVLQSLTDRRPEVKQINFAPRVRVPTLMLNGRYDPFFPVEASQVPMFQLLGTPAEHKRHRVYEESHYQLPRREVVRETLDWLDRYLGPTS